MLRSSSLLACTLVFSGCVSLPKRTTPPPNKPLGEVQEKAGTDVPATPPKDVIPVPSEAEQLAFLRRHARSGSSFGEDAHKFVGALPDNPEAGSITEAALAIGLIKTVLHPLGYVTSSFEEQDISGDASETETARGPSLSKLCDERGINLADALAENPLLASASVAQQALAAIERGPNPEEFKTDVRTAIARHAHDWSQVTADLGITPEPEQQDQDLVEAPSDSLPPNPADIKSGDVLIMEAQALADKGDYRAAIEKVRLVPKDSPMYTVAQEKIQEFSNQGVQQLRRKAARAFQNAMPITDAKVRAKYLEKAKQYLEEAINNFPDASQLPTVRDNLRVISRDLERLKSEIEGH